MRWACCRARSRSTRSSNPNPNPSPSPNPNPNPKPKPKPKPKPNLKVPLTIRQAKDIAHRLLASRVRHRQGAVDPPPVLVSAGPGTGKTWSALQLAHELAVLSGGAESKGGFGAFAPVPILIFVQRLSRHVRSARQQRLPCISPTSPPTSPLYLPHISAT